MFGSKKNSDVKAEQEQQIFFDPTAQKGVTQRKGAPTPRRKDAEAARRRPLVADKSSLTKEQKKQLRAEERARSNELYYKQQNAMRTGDQKNMPYQHQGKVRAWGRDYLDASAPISQWILPVALLMLPLIFFGARVPTFTFWATIAIYVIFVIMLVHLAIVVNKLKRRATAKFGAAAIPRGFSFQMFGRGLYPPRWRLPSPMVKRGEFPEGAKGPLVEDV